MEKYKPELANEKLKVAHESVETLKNIIAILEVRGFETFKKIFKN